MPEHGSSPNLDKLRQETGCEWQHLADAAALSQEGRLEIEGLFQQARKIGQRFQDGLLRLFFETNDDLSKATREYGVF